MLEKIFDFLTTPKDITTLRGVCSRTKFVVDELIGNHARIEHDKPHSTPQLDFYSSTALRSAWISGSAHFHASLIKVESIISKPNILRSMTFNKATQAHLPLYILQNCRNLENFQAYGKLDGQITLPPSGDRIHFDHLTSIDLRMVEVSDSSKLAACSTINTFTLLEIIEAPALKIFCTEMWVIFPIAEIHTCLVDFLLRNGANLEKLFICLRWKDVDPNEELLTRDQEIFKSLNNKLSSGKKFDLQKEMATLGNKIQLDAFLTSIHLRDDPCLHFLRGQKKLRKIGICDDLGFVRWSPFELAVRNNKATLRTVYLMSHFLPHETLNFVNFEGCTNLQELLIINLNYTRNQNAINLNLDHFDNFHVAEFCPNLSFIATTNISFARNKLSQLTELKKLKYLALLNSGEGETVGMNLDIMISFLNMRSLEGLVLDGVIAQSAAQLRRINRIIRALKEPEDEEWDDFVINVRDVNDSENRRWSRSENGFVFDIDFYAD